MDIKHFQNTSVFDGFVIFKVGDEELVCEELSESSKGYCYNVHNEYNGNFLYQCEVISKSRYTFDIYIAYLRHYCQNQKLNKGVVQ